jgi:hypothetical protein
MMEALSSSGTSVLTTATWHNIPEDTILHGHRRENLKSYKDIKDDQTRRKKETLKKNAYNGLETGIQILSGRMAELYRRIAKSIRRLARTKKSTPKTQGTGQCWKTKNLTFHENPLAFTEIAAAHIKFAQSAPSGGNVVRAPR